VVGIPGYLSGSFFCNPFTAVYKDAGWVFSSFPPSRAGNEIQLPEAGTYCITFSLYPTSYLLPINSVNVFGSCTSTGVTLLGQTKTSGSASVTEDQFIFVVACSGSGSIYLPNGTTNLTNCFGSHWTASFYCCCGCSIVQIE